jgi:hypothetical protein
MSDCKQTLCFALRSTCGLRERKSCRQSSPKEKQSELKEKQSELKEKQSELKEKQSSL